MISGLMTDPLLSRRCHYPHLSLLPPPIPPPEPEVRYFRHQQLRLSLREGSSEWGYAGATAVEDIVLGA